MSDIDDKLREILILGDRDVLPANYDQQIEAIHSAFGEAGYIPMSKLNQPRNMMTGSEFYERFVFEYKHKVSYGLEYAHTKDALEAAKRAAGLDT